MTREGRSCAAIGVDAAIVASHQIAVRGETTEDFSVSPTLAGLNVDATIGNEPDAPVRGLTVRGGCWFRRR